MENNHQGARKYSSKIIADVMASITPLESLQVETRFVLAGRIAGIMDSRHMSNKELAARMGKNPSEISRWLSGTHNFTIDTLSEIAIALEVPVATFFSPAQPRVVRDVRLTVRSGNIPADSISFSPVTNIR
ncbi:helix-turn-helix domain-containing protein [Chitinophaga oryzae]|nr:helix-turn-helix transcriptional regulator [Chitinophaga oryzae]